MTLALEVDDGVIRKVGVIGTGCAISVASSSMLAEAVEGKTLAEAQDLAQTVRGMMRGEEPPANVELGDMDALKGVRNFPVRVKCALLSWVTLEDAIASVSSNNSANGYTTTEHETLETRI